MLMAYCFCIMFDLAPNALHHIALSSYMAHLSIRLLVRGARTESSSGTSSSRSNH
jgi:uncharacterized membrane protein YjjB (DUF3815 family)